MILHYLNFGDDGLGIHLQPPSSIFVLLPRMVSSFMMHLNVMGDIEQGIAMMKYAVNHPYMFRPMPDHITCSPQELKRKDKYKKDSKKDQVTAPLRGPVDSITPTEYHSGMQRRAMLAFLLGFMQAMVAIWVESLIIYYFSCLTSFIKIVTQYVALAAVMKFDNFYSKTLYDHGVKASQGKNLKNYHKRWMLFKTPQELREQCELADDRKKYINPRQGRCLLKFLRFI